MAISLPNASSVIYPFIPPITSTILIVEVWGDGGNGSSVSADTTNLSGDGGGGGYILQIIFTESLTIAFVNWNITVTGNNTGSVLNAFSGGNWTLSGPGVGGGSISNFTRIPKDTFVEIYGTNGIQLYLNELSLGGMGGSAFCGAGYPAGIFIDQENIATSRFPKTTPGGGRCACINNLDGIVGTGSNAMIKITY